MTSPVKAQPLSGWRVLIPRPAGRGSALLRILSESGAEGHAVPFIEISPPKDTSAIDSAVISLSRGDFDWVGFTSVNAVQAVSARSAQLDADPVVSADCQVAAVGKATAAALKQAGLPVDLLPEIQSAAGLANIWPKPKDGSRRVLLPQSDIALPTLAALLTAAGFEVETVTAYRTTTVRLSDSVVEDVTAGAYDAILLTSPSTVKALVDCATPAATTHIGVIGATTAAAADTAGLSVSFISEAATDSGLATALAHYAAGHGRLHEGP